MPGTAVASFGRRRLIGRLVGEILHGNGTRGAAGHPEGPPSNAARQLQRRPDAGRRAVGTAVAINPDARRARRPALPNRPQGAAQIGVPSAPALGAPAAGGSAGTPPLISCAVPGDDAARAKGARRSVSNRAQL